MLLWLKALHVTFVVTWFAGLFYLPRLFVYHAAAQEGALRDQFAVMERRLFGIMTIGAVLAVTFGIAMLVTVPAYLSSGWLQLKLLLVGALIGYHIWCAHLMGDLRRGVQQSDRWYRIFNEVPALLLLAIVILAVVKPF